MWFKEGGSDIRGGRTWCLVIQCSVDMANYQFTMLIEHLIACIEQMAWGETCPPAPTHWVLFLDQLEEVGWERGRGRSLCPALKPPCLGTWDPLLPSSLLTSTTAKFRWGENYAGRYFSKLCVNNDVCQTKLHLHLFLSLIAHLNKLEGWWERRKKGKGAGGGKVRRQERGSERGFAKINAWMPSLTDWHLWSEL